MSEFWIELSLPAGILYSGYAVPALLNQLILGCQKKKGDLY